VKKLINGKKVITGLILLMFISTLLVGCGAKEEAQPVELTVSAAASLKDAMEEVKTVYAQENPKVVITYNFGASGALQQQIEQGAPADMFISAAKKNMDPLDTKGLLADGTRKDLLLNEVVLVVPKNSSAITGWEDLTSDKIKKLAMGEPESVPAGKYGQEILTKLGSWDKVKAKAVYAKDVRQVLNYVETVSAEAGIVYKTDAMISDKVKVVAAAPSGSHTPVIYPVAIIKNSQKITAATEFATFLTGDKAKAVFEKYGFVMVK